MNYFVEGLQGSGKSTLVRKLAAAHPDYQAVYEGDYSPVELAWCAYAATSEYDRILEKYQEIRKEIEAKTHEEEDRRVISYTQVITDIPGFHKDLEQYEIYNNRVPFDTFKEIILQRYRKWNGDKTIFECALFQNIVEDMILYRDAADQEIICLYKEIRKMLRGKKMQILYLETGDIAVNIEFIRKERSDDRGNELWFPMLLRFFNESPFAKNRGISGEAALLEHLSHRQSLELRICREVFPDRFTVFPSKQSSGGLSVSFTERRVI